MGAATRQAEAAGLRALDDVVRRPVDLGEQLLAAARALASSNQLVTTLADAGIEADQRRALVERVFQGRLGTDAQRIVGVLAAERWSDAADLVDGVERVALAALATGSDGTGLDSELFAVQQAVGSDAELELALGDQAVPLEVRSTLIDQLLRNAKASTRAIVRHVVALPRGRRIVVAIGRAQRVVALSEGRLVAVVTTASPLDAGRADRLEQALERAYGRKISINQVIDPVLVGGVRIAIGDDVIDGSVRARLDDLRLQLAG